MDGCGAGSGSTGVAGGASGSVSGIGNEVGNCLESTGLILELTQTTPQGAERRGKPAQVQARRIRPISFRLDTPQRGPCLRSIVELFESRCVHNP